MQSKVGFQFNNQSLIVRLGYNPTHLAGISDFLTSLEQLYAGGARSYISDADLDTILRQIQPELKTRKVLLVGHSQGTFYTNAMYQYLLAHGVSEDAIAVYNVATPADYVAGNGKYLTSTNDAAIAQVRALAEKFHAPAPLPANISIPARDASSSYPGHSFIDDYLAEAPGRIVSDLQTELGWLKVSGTTTALSGCFDAPQLTDKDVLSSAFYTVYDPVFAEGAQEIRGGADIAIGAGDKALALAKAAYAASVAAGESASRAVAIATSELYGSLNDILALHSNTATSSAPAISNGQSASVGEVLTQRTPSVVPSNGTETAPASASTPKPMPEPPAPTLASEPPAFPPPSAASSSPTQTLPRVLAENDTPPPPAPKPAPEITGAALPAQDATPAPQGIEAGPIAVSPGFGGGAPAPAPDDSHRTENTSGGAPSSAAGAAETASSTGAVSTSTPPASGSQSAGTDTASTTDETASSTEAAASSTPTLAAPIISIPACAHSLAPSGETCLLSTTSVELAWAEVPGAAHYEVEVGLQGVGSSAALAASTTATSSRLRLTDEAMNTVSVAAFDEEGDRATSSPVSVYAFKSPVRINEVSWAGTDASSSDQWLELANRSSEPLDLSHFSLGVSDNAEDAGAAPLTGIIPHGSQDGPGFIVLYRARPLQDIPSAQLPAAFSFLSPAGAQLQLLAQTANGEVRVDETPTVDACGGWCAGEEENDFGPGSPATSMERILLDSDGGDPDNWQDNDGVTIDGLDASSSPIYGTPGAQNSDPAQDWANSGGGGPTLQ